MPFIKLHPLQEIEQQGPEHFGHGHPARCRAVHRFDLPELYLNLAQIAAFEECPLYLITEADPNALVNGIRIRLTSGELLVVADDPEDEALGFVAAVQRASRGEIVELGYSRYLGELERQKRL